MRRGCGVTADLLKHAAELPSSSKVISNYRRPAGKKKARAQKAKRAARARWGQPGQPPWRGQISASGGGALPWAPNASEK